MYDLLAALILLLSTSAFADIVATSQPTPSISATNVPTKLGLANDTVLIIRHAEKPEDGFDLSPEGHKRADDYPRYFAKFTVDDKPLHLDHLFATADSKKSHRPRLTIEPLAKSLSLPIDTRYSNKQVDAFAEELKSSPHGTNILISWHHGEIPHLVTALGGDAAKLFPGADPHWPDDEFAWVIQMRFDSKGNLVDEKLIHEKLMPSDLAAHQP